MKKFKKIYIEITNICNLSCSFCSKTNKTKKELTIEEFETILKKIDDYTDYIYLHVKGEPLQHSKLEEILSLCKKYNKKVNITTNGTLLKERKEILSNNNCIRQLNISLHSENEKENYLKEVLEITSELSSKMNIVYRFWTLNNLKLDKKSTEIVENITEFYKLPLEIVEKVKTEQNTKIKDNIYINKANQFIWPSLENKYYNETGYCYGLKDQLGILVDGTIVICCLDGEGITNLGNIFTNDLKTILTSEKVEKIIKGFQNRKVVEELCKHCSFKDKFD